MPPSGHLYVVHFSTGDVKVGRGVAPEKRLKQHASNAAMFRAHVRETWVSAFVSDAADTETELIHRIELGGAERLPETREVFDNITFEEARALAEVVVFEVLQDEAVADDGARVAVG